MNQIILVVVVLIVQFIQMTYGDISLNFKLENFENKFGLRQNGEPCDQSTMKCLTFFKFCLKLNENSNQCLAEFKTDILGENEINEEQFKLTTDSIDFVLTNKYILKSSKYQISLLVQAFHYQNDKQQEEAVLINEWSLILKQKFNPIIIQRDSNEWINFASSKQLNQIIQFKYQIKCLKSYTGDLCQFRRDETCGCLNGGTCLNNYDSINQCLCPPGYSGNKCQIKRTMSNCGQVTCLNGGICMINNENEYTCQCKSEFTGPYCNILIQKQQQQVSTTICSNLNLCGNNGVCIVSNENEQGFKCECKSGFSGKLCDQSVFSFKEITLIIIFGMGIPVLLILLTIIILRLKKQKSTNDIENNEQFKKQQNDFEITDNKKQDNNNDDEVKKSKASSFLHNNLFDPIKADLNEKQLCIKTISSTINENSYFNNNNNNNNQKENIKDYFNNLDKCAKGNKMAFYLV
jgi:hypothetical protein